MGVNIAGIYLEEQTHVVSEGRWEHPFTLTGMVLETYPHAKVL